jgi:Flp pilus assembly pilin Flp
MYDLTCTPIEPVAGTDDAPAPATTTVPEPVLWRWVFDHRPASAAPAPRSIGPDAGRRLEPADLLRSRPTLELDAGPPATHDEDGQATAEYALVLLGAAAIALLVVSWATKTNVVGKLLDLIFSQLIGHVTGGH